MDVDGLRELLAADVQLVADGGGKAPQWAGGLHGSDRVAGVPAAVRGRCGPGAVADGPGARPG
ncbi:hypothetical protein [Kitasatospora sp. NPDC056181]|uniref:hypothetical protein n=1 Tax=Kitasatospora sp. NPDC056181 TaxID=3345737 RepID=UPI0035D669FE